MAAQLYGGPSREGRDLRREVGGGCAHGDAAQPPRCFRNWPGCPPCLWCRCLAFASHRASPLDRVSIAYRMLTFRPTPITISRSKIEPPLLSGHWVRRPLLETRLDRALARSLLVIAAPAGHGKTSTIVCWLQLRELDAAWVTVDDRDADLTRFAAHVAMALDRIVPGVATLLFSLLTVPDRLPPVDLGEAFAEILYDLERDVVLVLDDFHAAGNGAIGKFVLGLLQSAPRRLHTIL